MHKVVQNQQKSEVLHLGELESLLYEAEDRDKIYKSKIFSTLFFEKINRLFFNSELLIVSVDVFDTILLRDDVSEQMKFYNISEKQASFLNRKNATKFNAIDVYAARLNATKMSYRASKLVKNCREGSIYEITQSICDCLKICRTNSQDLLRIELEHEAKVTRANEGLYNLLKILASRGIKLILVSDMYLHSKNIAEIFHVHFPKWNEVIGTIYSSADYTISKASGYLFEAIKDELSIPADKWLHLGDSFIGDYLCPKELGIKALHFPISRRSASQRDQCEAKILSKNANIGISPQSFSA